MLSLRTSFLALAGAACLTTGVIALRSQQRFDAGGLPALPEEPRSALEVLELVPFTLEEPAVHDFRLEAPSYDAGYLIVIRTDPELAYVRQGYEAVLCAGRQTVARRNASGPENVVVGVLPAPRGEDGLPDVDWARTPIWYGSPELPERVDAAWLEREYEAAQASGVTAMPATSVSDALRDVVHLDAPVELDGPIADLIERHSPSEVDLVRGLRF